jgi:cobalt/nickel transport system permease protein
MHIPDGFIAPQFYLPAYAAAGVGWWWAARGLRARIDPEQVPRLAALTALSYGLGLVMLPLPGGTSGHVIGVALLALVFGLRPAFLAYTLVLVLQSLLIGAGGITALPVNALAIGLAGAACALGIFRLLRGLHETLAVALAAWCSVVVSAVLVALTLGVQPLIARHPDGTPLFFPFGLEITVPAVLLPHALIGVAEALLTVAVWRYACRHRWVEADPSPVPSPQGVAALPDRSAP